MRRALFLLAVASTLLTGCGDAQNEFSSAPCYVQVDNSKHQDATLASAMNPSSPGVFCIVSRQSKAGAAYFAFSNNVGQSSTSIYNAIDKRLTLVFGLNNGVIVGYGNLSSPAVFYAYDVECPNCFNFDKIPLRSYPLQMKPSGLAECTTCHRFYDMNNDGNVAQGEGGKALTRYIASTTGPYGVLMVN